MHSSDLRYLHPIHPTVPLFRIPILSEFASNPNQIRTNVTVGQMGCTLKVSVRESVGSCGQAYNYIESSKFR